MMNFPRIYSIHDQAITVEFSREINEQTHARVLSLRDAIVNDPFSGLLDCVPAYSSLTVYFDSRCNKKAAREYVQHQINNASQKSLHAVHKTTITIPVCYDPTLGADQQFVAAHLNISRESLIQQHTSTSFKVYMIGFVPGFPYMGILPEGWEIPRKQTPALNVPAGSVALAGKQTGIYPTTIPGGWQVIGRTPLRIFEPRREKPCLFNAGDWIQFESITLEEFNAMS